MANLDLDKIVKFDWSVITSKNVDVVYTNGMLSESIYPDLDKILFKWNWPGSVGWSDIWINHTPETQPNVKMFGAKAINEICQPQDISKIKNNTTVWSNAWFVFNWGMFNPSHFASITYRSLLQWFLPVGKTVWKKIKLFNYVEHNNNWVRWNFVYAFKTIKIDWTTRDIWTITVPTGSAPAMTWFFEHNGSWLVVDEWEMLIVELTTSFRNNSFSSSSQYFIYPWFEWWPNVYTHKDWYRPIEISIE